MYTAKHTIKHNGRYYRPGEAVPAEVAAAAPDAVDTVEDHPDAQQGQSQCAFIKGDGERCKNDAVPGSKYCRVPKHQAGE